MNILMTSMPTRITTYGSEVISMNTTPNTAIYLLAGILGKYKYNVNILDPSIIRECDSMETLEQLLINNVCEVDIVCFSSNTINWALTKSAIEIIRKHKCDKVKIILGGLHPTYFYEHILSNVDVDYILLGAGEIELPKLIDAIINRTEVNHIKGLVYKNMPYKTNNNVNKIDREIYSELPLPAYDFLPDKTYAMLPIEASRGCKYGCAFCSVPHKKDWIEFSQEDTIKRCFDIIMRFQSKFQTNQIFITDDCFTADLDRASKILESLFKINSNSKFLIETRATDWVNKIDDRIMNTFRNDQIGRLAIGVECGYDDGLRRIKKGLTLKKLEQAITFYSDNGLIRKTFFSFIIGFPWETIDEYLETINYAASIIQRFGPGLVNVNWLYLYPSEIWDNRRKYGIEVDQSIYDDLEFNLDKYFFETHPNISFSALQYINSIITEYEDQGIFLRNG